MQIKQDERLEALSGCLPEARAHSRTRAALKMRLSEATAQAMRLRSASCVSGSKDLASAARYRMCAGGGWLPCPGRAAPDGGQAAGKRSPSRLAHASISCGPCPAKMSLHTCLIETQTVTHTVGRLSWVQTQPALGQLPGHHRLLQLQDAEQMSLRTCSGAPGQG